MQIDKQQIIDMLRSRGANDQADQAQSDLPDQVDTDQHADKLGQLGINPQDIIGDLGDLGGKVGL